MHACEHAQEVAVKWDFLQAGSNDNIDIQRYKVNNADDLIEEQGARANWSSWLANTQPLGKYLVW